jgi:UDP-N-acetylmuramoylalanine--D-glutamate ligase
LAGNIGKPVLGLLPSLNKSNWIVLEMSSFQLIDMKKSPHISVILNITSDHLDWHRNQKEYVDSKTNIVRYQSKRDFAIISRDYSTSNNFRNCTKAKKYYFSTKSKVLGSYVVNRNIYLSTSRKKTLIGSVDNLKLMGKHNWENVAAAVCASKLAGCSLKAIKKTTFSFRGLEHRLELVRNVDGVEFYNDSFATGPSPTIAAIRSFSKPVTLIMGGHDKKLDYSKLYFEINERNNIKAIVLIGYLAKKMEVGLEKSGFNKKIVNLGKTSMKSIVRHAHNNSSKDSVILLSPATSL